MHSAQHLLPLPLLLPADVLHVDTQLNVDGLVVRYRQVYRRQRI